MLDFWVMSPALHVLLPVILLGLLVITALAGLGREASAGMTRWLAHLCGIGIIMALLLPSWWQTALLLSIVWNVQRQHPPSSHNDFLERVLVITCSYLILIQYSWAWLIEPMLWTLTGLGTYLGLWGLYSVLVHKGQPYQYTWGRAPYLSFTVAETGYGRPGVKQGDILCGQFMTNFTQAVFCLTIAATVGLAVTGYPWAGWLLLPQLFPLVHYLKIHFGFGQWVVHLGVLALAVVALYEPWTAFNLAWVGALAFLVFLWKYQRLGWEEGGADSGRLVEWQAMWKVWHTSRNWWTYLFGFGIRAWVQVAYDKALYRAKTTGKTSHNIFTMAHNEYIQQLFEYGIIGLVALTGLSIEIAIRAYSLHAGLWLLVMVMFSIAQLSYPWAFYHRAIVPAMAANGKQAFHEHRFGSPFLFYINFLLMVLLYG